MTSKNLYFKKLKKDLEQRIWLPVVFWIITFLTLELPLFSKLEYLRTKMDFRSEALLFLMNDFFTPNTAFLFLTICVAFISALSGFSYMHSQKKLDVYHSMPIKREKLFAEQYSYGILYYLIPALFHILVCIIICMVNGVATLNVLGQAFGFCGVLLLIYIATYSLTVLTVCLTGNMVISVLGSALLFLYSWLLEVVIYFLKEGFYYTFFHSAENKIWAFSPMHLLLNMFEKMEKAEEFIYADYIGFYVKFIGMILVFTFAALMLYKKRPTEAAGKTIVFSHAEPIIKTIVVFPVSILVGFLFRSITGSYYSIGWFVFGCIFGFLIICPAMEIIFRNDVKAVLGHPVELVVNGGIVLCVVMIFIFDLLGYDTYVPAKEEIENIGIDPSKIDKVYGSYGYNSIGNQLNEMTITENESLRKLIEHGAEITRSVKKEMQGDYDLNDDEYSGMSVKYQLKNGKKIYRNYLIHHRDEQVLQWLADVYGDVEYKSVAYPVLNEKQEKSYVDVVLDYGFDVQQLPMSKEKMEQFVAVYQQELLSLTLDEIRTEYPLVTLSLAVGVSEDDISYEECGYMVYPSFTQTIELLEEWGAVFENKPSAKDVLTIQVEDSRLEDKDYDGIYDKVVNLEYTNENGGTEIIEEILASIQSADLVGSFSEEKIENSIRVYINYMKDGYVEYDRAYFSIGNVPQKVRADIDKQMNALLGNER